MTLNTTAQSSIHILKETKETKTTKPFRVTPSAPETQEEEDEEEQEDAQDSKQPQRYKRGIVYKHVTTYGNSQQHTGSRFRPQKFLSINHLLTCQNHEGLVQFDCRLSSFSMNHDNDASSSSSSALGGAMHALVRKVCIKCSHDMVSSVCTVLVIGSQDTDFLLLLFVVLMVCMCAHRLRIKTTFYRALGIAHCNHTTMT